MSYGYSIFQPGSEYEYKDSNGEDQRVTVKNLDDAIKLDNVIAEINIKKAQARFQESVAFQNNVQSFLNVMAELRMTLISVQVDDNVEERRGNNPPVRGIFTIDEQNQTKKKYAQVLDATVKYVTSLNETK